MGSQPSLTPNRYMRRSASQKVGTAKPINTNTVIPLSNRVSRRMAARMPIGIASPNSMISEIILRERVTGIRSLILSTTGRLSGAEGAAEIEHGQLFYPDGILHVKWLVEAVEFPQALPRLGGHLGVHGDLHLHRFTWGEVDHRKGDEGDPEEERDHHDEAF